ncbi:UNVERIFIED_CONTAM: hypothetical protein HDU68_005362 [Siphonaria sp. JEL0065]|nr:hypothetical protein HDU68_005362 [Siphonaria sp. JEL0065]
MSSSSIRSSSVGGWEDIVRIKLEYNSTVRQLVFDDAVSWGVFASKVKEIYRLPSHVSISAFYVDEDGDTIQIDSDSELADLVKLPRIPKLSIAISETAHETASTVTVDAAIAEAPVVEQPAAIEQLSLQQTQSLPRYQDPFQDPINQEEPNSTISRAATPLSRVQTAVVQEPQHARIPVNIAYPTLDLESHNEISMHDVESVAPSENASTDAAPVDVGAPVLEFVAGGSAGGQGEIHKIPGAFPSAASANLSASAEVPVEETVPATDEQRTNQQQTLIIDMSEIISMIKTLAEKVTNDPDFMNSAVRTLHEFAESSKSHFEDLFRMFNELLNQRFSSDFSSPTPGASSTPTNPPRYSVVFDDKGASTSRSEKKPFVIRFDGDNNTNIPQTFNFNNSSNTRGASSSSSATGGFQIRFNPPEPPRPPQPPQPPQPPSTPWSAPIHFCTGITDECRHLHNQSTSYTPSEGIRRAATSAKSHAAQAKLAAEMAAAQAHVAAAQAAATAHQAAVQARFAASAAADVGGKGAKEVGDEFANAVKAAVEAGRHAATSAHAAASTGADDARETAARAAADGQAAAAAATTHFVNTLKAVVGTVGGVIRAVGSSSSLRQQANEQDIGSAPRWKYTTCDICGIKGFTGPRYKCNTCRDYDICGVCYYTSRQDEKSAAQHDPTHEFTRIDHPNEGNRSKIEAQVDRVIEMGVAEGVSRARVEELVVHFGGDLDRVVEVLMDERMD